MKSVPQVKQPDVYKRGGGVSLTTCGTKKRRKRQAGIVGDGVVRRPHIRICAFNQDQSGSTKEPCEESADRQSRPRLREGSTQGEEGEDEDEDGILQLSAHPFAHMRHPHGGEHDPPEKEGEGQDGLCHRYVEFYHDSRDADGIGGGAKSSGTYISAWWQQGAIWLDEGFPLTQQGHRQWQQQKCRASCGWASSEGCPDHPVSSGGPMAAPGLRTSSCSAHLHHSFAAALDLVQLIRSSVCVETQTYDGPLLQCGKTDAQYQLKVVDFSQTLEDRGGKRREEYKCQMKNE